jgi:hypothetical protein
MTLSKDAAAPLALPDEVRLRLSGEAAIGTAVAGLQRIRISVHDS